MSKISTLETVNINRLEKLNGLLVTKAADPTGVEALCKTLAVLFPSSLIYQVNGEWTIKVQPAQIEKLLFFLKKHTQTNFEQLRDITAVDNRGRKLRYEVIYQLLSIKYNTRLTVTVSTADGLSVPSVGGLYSSALGFEREVWDRFGVYFQNHPDLRRRLTDYGFKGHPLRKDFPLTGFIEVRYKDAAKRIVYEQLSLAQEYRAFNLKNNW